MLDTSIFRALVLFLLVYAAPVLGCQEEKIPMHFLGQHIGEVLHDFSELAAIREFQDDPIISDGRHEMLLAIWQKQYFMKVYLVDGIVSELIVEDRRLRTNRDVRVGNSFAEIRKAYPDASFNGIDDYRYHSDDYIVKFSFDTSQLWMDRTFQLEKLREFDLNSAELQEVKLQAITILLHTSK